MRMPPLRFEIAKKEKKTQLFKKDVGGSVHCTILMSCFNSGAALLEIKDIDAVEGGNSSMKEMVNLSNSQP